MDDSTLEAIAEFICGDNTQVAPIYRSGSELTRFFYRAGLGHFRHDGSTRKWWTLEALRNCSEYELILVVKRLASPKEYEGNQEFVKKALDHLNKLLNLESLCVQLDGIEPIVKSINATFELAPEIPEEPQLLPLPPPNFQALGLESGIGELLAQRWNEAQICVESKAYLAALVIMGSLLEGSLLSTMQKYPSKSNQTTCSPKDKATGKVKHFADWTLTEMIEVAHELGWLDLDVKKFSHALREFRNLIHPYQQLLVQCFPDEDTCKISWLVVQAASNDLARVLMSKT